MCELFKVLFPSIAPAEVGDRRKGNRIGSLLSELDTAQAAAKQLVLLASWPRPARNKVGQLQHAIPFVNDTLAEHRQELQLKHIHSVLLYHPQPIRAPAPSSSSSSSSKGCRPQKQQELQEPKQQQRVERGRHFVDLLTFCDVIKVDCHRLLHVLA